MLTTFWSSWVILVVLAFFAVMIYVVGSYWRINKDADKDRELYTFDGVGENDAKIPRILLLAYAIGFVAVAIFFLLYPGMGNWGGLMGWKSQDELQFFADGSLTEAIQSAGAGESTGSGAANLEQLAQSDEVIGYGATLFKTHCAACHGDDAQGQKHFPNLTDDESLYGGSDQSILHAIEHGRHGVMVGWRDVLTDQQIENVSAYVASLQPERQLSVSPVSLISGEELFSYNCSVCHGDDAKGNQQVGASDLTDAVWVHGGSLEDIENTVRNGLDSPMPAFGDQLNREQILALAAFIKRKQLQSSKHLATLNGATIKRGEYLAYAGDCVACHTAENGELFGGGLPFPTPFGNVYSTNISPHRDKGIGRYTYDEFARAVRDGKGKHGNLYPAMPYTSYQYVTDEDTQALWQFLQSLPPVNRENTPDTMMFPSNIRMGLGAWNLAFFDRDPLSYPGDKSEKWKRGKYLTLGLGHCAECHTPRNLAQAMKSDAPMQGNVIDYWNAPDITANELYENGWTEKDIVDFLKTGDSAKGTAFAGMADVVKNSTRHMSREDLSAMATYLLEGDVGNVRDPARKRLAPSGFTAADKQREEYRLFAETCGACHGQDGEGRKDIAPALLGNGIIAHSEPYNTIAVVLRGLSPDYLEPNRDYMPMTSFNDIAGDGQIAAVITFIREKLGGRDTPVTREMVRDLRRTLEKNRVTGGFHEQELPPQ
ncbi:c-type cytochrome [uncultured Microbulbifer sp.]|uniref:c-type cytochrome n=1 Tax=uncultured Microbulbifer sp. TaxID=348147 RepID=UPI00260C5CAC|nr:c-type cytochrome [uncultured Microbulbifer sp.]